MDVRDNPVGRIDVLVRDVLPNLVEIGERIGMERSRSSARSPTSLLSRSFLNASSPSIGFTRPLLRSSYRLSSVLRTEATSSRYPASASSTMSSGAHPLVVARSFSFLAVSGVTCTSMPLLYGFGDRPASAQAALRRLSICLSQPAI